MPYHRHRPVFYRSYHPGLRSDIARLSDMILLRRALVEHARVEQAKNSQNWWHRGTRTYYAASRNTRVFRAYSARITRSVRYGLPILQFRSYANSLTCMQANSFIHIFFEVLRSGINVIFMSKLLLRKPFSFLHSSIFISTFSFQCIVKQFCRFFI